ncbi:MAG TPA: hypothetical protein PK970_01270 [Hyphomicrobiaceae bacterium]|nr:hypothetical protein [Hyphomicrobiaceae bacterium]
MSSPQFLPRRSSGPRTPRLLRFLAQHLAFGVALGLAIALIIASANIGGFRTLMTSDQNPLLVLFLLMVTLGLTFGSLAMGIAVMTLPWGRAFDEIEDEADKR